jgi:hypothetical protein
MRSRKYGVVRTQTSALDFCAEGVNTMQSRDPKPAFGPPTEGTEPNPRSRDHSNPQLLGGPARDQQRAPSALDVLPAPRPIRERSRYSHFPTSGSSVVQLHTADLEPFVEAEAAADFLHYSSRNVKQMAREGKIPAHPFGSGPRKRWYFLISELAEHLRAQVNSPHGEVGRDKMQRRVV